MEKISRKPEKRQPIYQEQDKKDAKFFLPFWIAVILVSNVVFIEMMLEIEKASYLVLSGAILALLRINSNKI